MRHRVSLLLWVAGFSFLISTGLFWLFEQGANAQIAGFFDVVWWWVVTSATVGYGDIVPVTTPGRGVTILSIITGFYIYTNFVAIIAESVHEFMERRQLGTAQVTARNHIVVCEYTAVADELIRSLPRVPEFRDHEVAVVSDLVARNPHPQHHFVIGVPFNPEALRRANVQHADYVFVFANFRFADPDVKTMHVASRVLDVAPHATVFVELVDPENELLQHAPKELITMDSRKLIEAVLRREPIDPSDWLEPHRSSGQGAAG